MQQFGFQLYQTTKTLVSFPGATFFQGVPGPGVRRVPISGFWLVLFGGWFVLTGPHETRIIPMMEDVEAVQHSSRH